MTDGRAALATLRTLQRRAFARKVTTKLKQPKSIFLVLVGLSLAAAIIYANSLHSFNATNVTTYVATGLVALLLLSAIAGVGNGAIYFRPAEVHFLFPAPLTTRQLLEHHLIVGSIRAALSVIIFVVVLPLDNAPIWRVFLGYATAFVVMMLIQIRIDLAHQHLHPKARKTRGRLYMFGATVIFATLAGAAYIIDGQQISAQVLRLIAYPARPVLWVMMGTLSEALGGLTILAALCALLARSVLRYPGDIREGALATSERFAKMIAQASAGKFPAVDNDDSTKTVKGRTLRMLPRWRGAGVFAWRQLVSLKRARMAYGMLIYMSVIGGGVAAFISDNNRVVSIVTSTLAILSFAGPMYVRCDFRSDTEQLAYLRSLPVSPTTLAWGQMGASALVLSAIQWIFCAWGIALLPIEWWPAAILGLLALPLVNLWQITVWNGAHLVAPSKLIGDDGQPSFTQLARQSLVMFVLGFVVMITAIPVTIGGALGYFAGDAVFDSLHLVAIPTVLGAMVVLTATVAALVWCVGRLFTRATLP